MDSAFYDIRNTESGSLFRCSEFPFVDPEHPVPRYLRRIILGDDVHAFGLALSQRVQAIVDGISELEDFFFVTMGMGQCMDADYALKNVIALFQLRYLEELVVHVAIDVHKPGHAIFWKRDMLQSRKNGNLYAEYFPLFTRGAGNFYYSVNRVQFGSRPRIRMIKFYGEGMKNVHTIRNAPFKESNIGPALWNSMFWDRCPTAKEKKVLNDISRLLRVFKGNVQNLIEKPHLRCRAEFIVSTLWPEEDAGSTSVEMVKQEYFSKSYNLENGFKVMAMAKVRQLVMLVLDPVFRTIELEVEKCIEQQLGDSDVIYTITVEQYHTIAAAEAILSFFTYGMAVSTGLEKHHNNELCKMLGLQQHAFSRETNQQMFLGCISLVHTNTTIKLSLPNGCVIKDLFWDQTLAPTMKLPKFVDELEQEFGTSEVTQYGKMFAEYILKQVIRSRNAGPVPEERLCLETHKHLRGERILVHSMEFMKIVLGGEVRYNRDYRRRALNSVNRLIRIRLGSKRFAYWQVIVCRELENMMWRQRTFIVFPINNEESLICVPFISMAKRTNALGNRFGFQKLFYRACKECCENLRESRFAENVTQLVQQLQHWPLAKIQSLSLQRLVNHLALCAYLKRSFNAIPLPRTVFTNSITRD